MRDIPGYETFYAIAPTGKVWSHKNQRFLIPWLTNKRRVRVSLKGKTHSVHRLVAITYLPNPANHPMINHKDLDPSNNNSSNLEWCTARYNVLHAIEHGVHIAYKNRKLTDEQVRQIRRLCKRGVKVKQVSKVVGCGESSIFDILAGRTYRLVQ